MSGLGWPVEPTRTAVGGLGWPLSPGQRVAWVLRAVMPAMRGEEVAERVMDLREREDAQSAVRGAQRQEMTAVEILAPSVIDLRGEGRRSWLPAEHGWPLADSVEATAERSSPAPLVRAGGASGSWQSIGATARTMGEPAQVTGRGWPWRRSPVAGRERGTVIDGQGLDRVPGGESADPRDEDLAMGAPSKRSVVNRVVDVRGPGAGAEGTGAVGSAGSVVSRETTRGRHPATPVEDPSAGQQPDPGPSVPVAPQEAQLGWMSWREVNGHGSRTAVDALTVDPMETARRLLGGRTPDRQWDDAATRALDLRQLQPRAAPVLVSRETDEVCESGVSRETADVAEGVTDVSTDLSTDAAPEASSTETVTHDGGTGQTAPESRESAIDGSPAMHEVTVDAWRQPGAPVAPPSPYEDEQQRQSLVGSLPRVDESTPLAFEVAEDARRRISLVGRPFPAPPRTRILTVANQKGGVGKTTTTVNVAAAMAQAGLNVLVLDIDPQGNASTALGIDHHADIPSLYDVVVEGTPLADVLQPCPDVANLWCAPATIDLAGAEIELVSMVAREMRLQKSLDAYLDERRAAGLPQVDYIFIDCPPSLSLLTINAFVAATEVFIPIQCEYYALEGLSQLLKHIELIRGHLNPRLHVSTILLTMYDGRTRLSSQVADEVRAHFADVVVRTSVPRSVRISEAPSHSQTVMTYDPASSGALSYLEAAREVAEQVLRWGPEATQEEHA